MSVQRRPNLLFGRAPMFVVVGCLLSLVVCLFVVVVVAVVAVAAVVAAVAC